MGFLDFLNNSELGKYVLTFLVSMVPIVELRGAIPIGVGMGLNPWAAMAVAVAGNMVPVPFIILFIRKIFEWLRLRSPKLEAWVENMESKAEGKWDRVRRYQLLGLTILVAIPLPGTGAWTGALIAGLFNIRMKYSIPCIFLGVLIAGVIVTGVTYGFTAIVA